MGYDREYRMRHGMWSKSSRRFADRMERNVLMLGLGLGASLLDGLSSAANGISLPIASVDQLHPKEKKANWKNVGLGCVCLVLMLIFQLLSYLSFARWGWWPFFSLLLFSTLALLALVVATALFEEVVLYRDATHNWLLAIVLVFALVYCGTVIWPILVDDSGITSLSCILMAFQTMGAILIVYYSWKGTKEKHEQKESEAIAVDVKQSTPKRTSRTTRIKEMEDRYDRVKAALVDLKKAEEKFSDLSDDIDTLREYVDSGKWQKDFEADEQGKIPKDLKRGVLSEDGLWNLLEEVDERL